MSIYAAPLATSTIRIRARKIVPPKNVILYECYTDEMIDKKTAWCSKIYYNWLMNQGVFVTDRSKDTNKLDLILPRQMKN